MQINQSIWNDQHTCIINLWRSDYFYLGKKIKKKNPIMRYSRSSGEAALWSKDSTCFYTWDTSGVEHMLILG